MPSQLKSPSPQPQLASPLHPAPAALMVAQHNHLVIGVADAIEVGVAQLRTEDLLDQLAYVVVGDCRIAVHITTKERRRNNFPT